MKQLVNKGWEKILCPTNWKNCEPGFYVQWQMQADSYIAIKHVINLKRGSNVRDIGIFESYMKIRYFITSPGTDSRVLVVHINDYYLKHRFISWNMRQ